MTETSEYLLVLYIAERRRSAPVSPGDVAEKVGRSPSSTTEMLQRLESRGLVTYEPYEGATLTAEGREVAKELHDTYVVLSRFFREVLGLDNHEEEAMRVSGTISSTVADRLASTLLDSDKTASGYDPSSSPSETDTP